MNLLALDASTDACSAALYADGQIFEQFQLAPKAHTRLLLPMIDALRQEAGVCMAEVDAFAFGCGPGSFTGVRIACSVVQALSFGLDRPVIPVSTLRALAQGAYRMSGVTEVLATLDARMSEIYAGLFEVNSLGIMQPTSAEWVSAIAQIEMPVGDWQSVTGFPMAQDIARIAALEYQAHKRVPASEALPVYLSHPVIKYTLYE